MKSSLCDCLPYWQTLPHFHGNTCNIAQSAHSFQDNCLDRPTFRIIMMLDLFSPFDEVIRPCVDMGLGINLVDFFTDVLAPQNFLSLPWICHLAAKDTLAAQCIRSTLSSLWGRLGAESHIRNPTVHLSFGTKFIHLITHVNLAQQSLLFRCEPLGRLVSSQRCWAFVTSAWFEMLCSFIVWTHNLLHMWTHNHRSAGSVFSQND